MLVEIDSISIDSTARRSEAGHDVEAKHAVNAEGVNIIIVVTYLDKQNCEEAFADSSSRNHESLNINERIESAEKGIGSNLKGKEESE